MRKIFLISYFLLFFIFLPLFQNIHSAENLQNTDKKEALPEEILFGIPTTPDLLISRKGFSLGYSYKYRQSVWISYILTEENLQKPKVKRRASFRIDPAIKYLPVRPRDYRKSGYDKGHLAPAADMTYSVQSMKNSFFMSNISPQIPGCNRGIWKRVEKQVRKWALQEKKLCIVTGPIFQNTYKNLRGIPIPTAFYKVILDLTPPMKMIAFIVPNAPSRRRINYFVTSVDKVEALTGYDFFSPLEDALENELEKECNIGKWVK